MRFRARLMATVVMTCLVAIALVGKANAEPSSSVVLDLTGCANNEVVYDGNVWAKIEPVPEDLPHERIAGTFEVQDGVGTLTLRSDGRDLTITGYRSQGAFHTLACRI